MFFEHLKPTVQSF